MSAQHISHTKLTSLTLLLWEAKKIWLNDKASRELAICSHSYILIGEIAHKTITVNTLKTSPCCTICEPINWGLGTQKIQSIMYGWWWQIYVIVAIIMLGAGGGAEPEAWKKSDSNSSSNFPIKIG